jgi:hypothetical protein
MPASNTMNPKTQPWKANWPPVTVPKSGETHGFKQGETLQLEGSAGAHPPAPADQKEQ